MTVLVWILIAVVLSLILAISFVRVAVMLVFKVVEIVILLVSGIGKIASQCVDDKGQKPECYYSQNYVNGYFSYFISTSYPPCVCLLSDYYFITSITVFILKHFKFPFIPLPIVAAISWVNPTPFCLIRTIVFFNSNSNVLIYHTPKIINL